MKPDLYLCCETFDYRVNVTNEPLAQCLDRISEVVDLAQKNNDNFLMSPNWFLQEVSKDSQLGNWIYETSTEDQTERSLMMLLVDQCEIVDNSLYEQVCHKMQTRQQDLSSAILCLYSNKTCNFPYDLYIHNRNDWFDVQRYFLRRHTNRHEFFDELSRCYPKLYFGENVRTSMNYFSPFRDFIDEIILHLNALNDYASEFIAYGEEQAIKRLNTIVICSGQGDPKYAAKHLNFPFANIKGLTEHEVCSPHTKLFHAGSDYRIYFTWKGKHIRDDYDVFIGHIGKHL